MTTCHSNNFQKFINTINKNNELKLNEMKRLFTKIIYEEAHKYIHEEDKDIEFNETDKFNPNLVIEFSNKHALRFIHPNEWNETIGLLPSRKVVGTYYINVINTLNEIDDYNHYCSQHKVFCSIICNGCQNTVSTDLNKCICEVKTIIKPRRNTTTIRSRFKTSCNCLFEENYNKIFKPCNELSQSVSIIERTYKFEIDNYLNLYLPELDIYFMYNKLPFHMKAFKQNILLTPQIYQNKNISRHPRLEQLFEEDENRLLDIVDELIPDNYDGVLHFYSNLREENSKESQYLNTSKNVFYFILNVLFLIMFASFIFTMYHMS